MRKFMGSTGAKVGAFVAVVASLVTVGVAAGADTISSAFTSTQTTLLGYLGDAVAMVIALLALGAGIRFLVKWVRKAVSSS